jgi:hypothetical protein
MKALILFFGGVFLLASCNSIHPFRSNYKFKTVKAKSIDATANLRSEAGEEVFISAENIPVLLEDKLPIDTLEAQNQTEILVISTNKSSNESLTKISQKPKSQLDEENPEVIKDLALEAEEKGRTSRNLGIAGFILSFIPIIWLLGLIFSIISFVNGIKALKSKYITEDGLRWAKTGVIFSSISLFLSLLVIILLILIFALF